MSTRAHFIIVEKGEKKIFRSKDGQVAPNILAQGLDFCESYFKKMHEDERLVLDNAFAEGGIMIDKDTKNILIFGGSEGEIFYYPALQRLYCEHVQKFWNGWNIQWCSKGIISIAEYLEMMDEELLADGCKPEFDFYEDKKPDDEFNSKDVITIICKDKIKDYYLDSINFCLSKGENLKDIIQDEFIIEQWHNEVETENCLLVDYNNKKIFVCWGWGKDDRYIETIQKYWSGWQVHRQTEGLVFHFDYTNRDRNVVEFTDEMFEQYIEDCVLFDFERDE